MYVWIKLNRIKIIKKRIRDALSGNLCTGAIYCTFILYTRNEKVILRVKYYFRQRSMYIVAA